MNHEEVKRNISRIFSNLMSCQADLWFDEKLSCDILCCHLSSSAQPADSPPGRKHPELAPCRTELSGGPDLPRFILQLFQQCPSCPGEAQRHGKTLSGRESALRPGYGRAAVAACSICRFQVRRSRWRYNRKAFI